MRAKVDSIQIPGQNQEGRQDSDRDGKERRDRGDDDLEQENLDYSYYQIVIADPSNKVLVYYNPVEKQIDTFKANLGEREMTIIEKIMADIVGIY